MVASRSTGKRPSRSRRQREFLQKPRGVVHPRVQRVGPEHFGIVCIDCHKARSSWMLCDFYGNVLIPVQQLQHNRAEIQAALAHIDDVCRQRRIHDRLVAIERTGRYHHVVRNAFAAAGYDVRIVHPHTTKHFRQPADPGIKTDDKDLAAIRLAAVNGFALQEHAPQEPWRSLQLLARHRRDLVHKNTILCCQIREHLEAAMPGYAACFSNLWDSQLALPLVRHFSSPQALLQAGRQGLRRWAQQQQLRCHQQSLDTILAWAGQAPPPELAGTCHRQLALTLDDDRQRKTQEIYALERTLANLLVQTPYVLLLSFPGLNVVWSSEFAGEMGPISHYANAKTITGRAGLFPSRYQSDRVDHANGPLVRHGNHRLRAVILGIADTLINCNQYFRAMSGRWRGRGDDPRLVHTRVGLRFCRIAYHLVAGQRVFRHPAARERSYILDKLLAFHNDHGTPIQQTLADLHLALTQIPKVEHADEAKPLAERLRHSRRARGPQPLAEILPLVLARLGVGVIQSPSSGESDLT
jgi:transposase